MVYINSKKYACESCIKGHRSSSCVHNDRPLFEIKKKGRPVSQCEKCREARQSRKIHAKCTCESERKVGTSSASGAGPSRKGKRFIPTVPSLPNGLRDVMKPQTTIEESSTTRRQVEALLNPCHCKDVYSCTCKSQEPTSVRPSIPPSIFNDGLSALAHVAACCAPASSSTLPAAVPIAKTAGRPPAYDRNGTKINFGAPSQMPSSSQLLPFNESSTSTRKWRSSSVAYDPTSFQHTDPIRPILDVRPSLELVSVNASIGKPSCCSSGTTTSSSRAACGCGAQCACAGCATHESEDMAPDSFVIHSPSEQGPRSARLTHKANCGADCPTCVDYDGGAEMPGTRQTPTFIDQFLQRASTLPPPPATQRARGTSLDPTNVIVYPPNIFKGKEGDERRRAFGLVDIPKLECCGGRCSCPENQCGCGDACGGCCIDDANPEPGLDTRQVSPSVSFTRGLTGSKTTNPL